jgi:carboxymethylenebutenolidase
MPFPLRILLRILCTGLPAILAMDAQGLRADAAATRPARQGSVVKVPVSGGAIDGYLARPAGKGPFPAVVVIQEWWGLNDQIRGVADRLAAEGFVAIAPDLYHGEATTDPEKAHELSRGLDPAVAVQELGAAMEYLRTLPEVGTSKIGSVGFCLGGRLSLALALERSDLSGAVIFYGSPETDPARLRNAACPILGLFGEEDRGIPRERVETMAKGLKEAGKEVEIHFYPKAGHAFFNETRPSHVPEAAADAWKRTLTFFRARLAR